MYVMCVHITSTHMVQKLPSPQTGGSHGLGVMAFAYLSSRTRGCKRSVASLRLAVPPCLCVSGYLRQAAGLRGFTCAWACRGFVLQGDGGYLGRLCRGSEGRVVPCFVVHTEKGQVPGLAESDDRPVSGMTAPYMWCWQGCVFGAIAWVVGSCARHV